MEFHLTIRLGNVAMQTPDDIADALDNIAREILRDERKFPGIHRTIFDSNGNPVGSYGVLPCA
jgi:hypothetical protein